MKRTVSFLVLNLTLTGCLTTPGIEEPSAAFVCTILDDKTAKCGPHGVVPMTHVIGFTCAGPRDTATFLNHHDELHSRLNECEKSK